jgi:hypothetical protein
VEGIEEEESSKQASMKPKSNSCPQGDPLLAYKKGELGSNERSRRLASPLRSSRTERRTSFPANPSFELTLCDFFFLSFFIV